MRGRTFTFRFPINRPDLENYFFKQLPEGDRVDILLKAVEQHKAQQVDRLRDEIRTDRARLLEKETALKVLEAKEAQARRRRLEGFDKESFYTKIDNLVARGQIDEAEAAAEQAVADGLVERATVQARMGAKEVGEHV